MTTDLVKRLRDAEPKVTRLARAVGMSVEDTGLCTEAAYLIESQAKEIERLRKDAERYRWLRGSADVPSHSVRWGRWEINHWEGANGWRNLLCSELDAAIDAAMQEKQP